MRCQSSSGSSGSAPMASGASAWRTAAAAISGGCSPWHSASPQPTRPSSVCTSTSVAPRLFTQPCEKANGSASGERSTCTRTSVIFMPVTILSAMLKACIAIVLVALVASGIQPYDRATWLMEVAPVLIAAPILLATYRRFPLTPLLYGLITIHALVLIVGG